MSWLRKLFSCKPNDWVSVWYDYAIWNVRWDYFDDSKEKCFFRIDYSSSRDKYRLETGGYHPVSHQYYKIAMNKLIEFNTKKI